ncbi:hypothetical protein D3C76_299310 [compost metagenome]|uniref:TniQ family protein n=1 Tax=Pseudomonas sp. ACN5 TaxID=1920427 RepID=UPI000BB34661|nr:TniQ family protein [Pseudomonas sp. ACN5]PBJ07754.1 hypothetical protein BSF40_19490 [Pseudomonas sp. ACN5]
MSGYASIESSKVRRYKILRYQGNAKNRKSGIATIEIKALILKELFIGITPLPGETLNSFLSRHHLYSCNSQSRATLSNVLGYIPASNSWSSYMLQRLATYMGGGLDTFKKLISYNTLHHQNFLTSHNSNTIIEKLYRTKKTNLLFFEQKAKHFRICITCWHNDIQTLGYGFIKTQHQTTEVKVCADHGVALIDKCQGCKKHFLDSEFIFDLPWRGCCCGWTIQNLQSPTISEYNKLDLDISRLAAFQLNTHFQIGVISLEDTYHFRAKELDVKADKKHIIEYIFFSAEMKYGLETLKQSIPDYLRLKHIATQELPPQLILSPGSSWTFHMLAFLSLTKNVEAASLLMKKTQFSSNLIDDNQYQPEQKPLTY